MSEPKTRDEAATPPRKNIVYNEAFRRDSVAAWRQSGQSVPKYAPQIGIHETTLYAWIREEDRPHGGGAKTPADVDSLQAENRQLRAECERLRTQRDILKKPWASSRNPPPTLRKDNHHDRYLRHRRAVRGPG